ncbi:MAG: hypothetical protein AAFR33_10570, partial [Pseudomonadota bacterium]
MIKTASTVLAGAAALALLAACTATPEPTPAPDPNGPETGLQNDPEPPAVMDLTVHEGDFARI